MVFIIKLNAIKEKLHHHHQVLIIICKFLLVFSLTIYFISILFFNTHYYKYSSSPSVHDDHEFETPHNTNLSHLVFGLLGSEAAWHKRKSYIESWWRPNATRGYLYLDKPPTGELLPWSPASPPYRISDDLTRLLEETRARAPVMIRMVHGIMEVMREEEESNNENLKWLVMGDDDSIFMVENIVDFVSKFDHTKYYYFGGHSEFIMSNYWYSFNQGFGGAGFILSYPLAKALAKDMENCLRRYAQLSSADHISMSCISDVGVNLSPHKGIHQIDLRGNISGFLSSHPQAPLISLHHFDAIDPIFPNQDHYESARHFMKAARFDQSRMLQQTICFNRQTNWSFSVSWGYSVHIYERIMPRSFLQLPIETFQTWINHPKPPHYMFNTRGVSTNPCDAPHVFFFDSAKETRTGEIQTVYSRAYSRGLSSSCFPGKEYSADYISTVEVLSPAAKRVEFGRCECCDIVHAAHSSKTAKIRFRECMRDEIIA